MIFTSLEIIDWNNTKYNSKILIINNVIFMSIFSSVIAQFFFVPITIHVEGHINNNNIYIYIQRLILTRIRSDTTW